MGVGRTRALAHSIRVIVIIYFCPRAQCTQQSLNAPKAFVTSLLKCPELPLPSTTGLSQQPCFTCDPAPSNLPARWQRLQLQPVAFLDLPKGGTSGSKREVLELLDYLRTTLVTTKLRSLLCYASYASSCHESLNIVAALLVLRQLQLQLFQITWQF